VRAWQLDRGLPGGIVERHDLRKRFWESLLGWRGLQNIRSCTPRSRQGSIIESRSANLSLSTSSRNKQSCSCSAKRCS
jgi:hypothetical protein